TLLKTPIIIDIGAEAKQRATHWYNHYTLVDKGFPANARGKINSVQIYAGVAMTNIDVATFFVVGENRLSTRDYENIATVALGYSEHEVNLDVEEGDYIGIAINGEGEIDHDAGEATGSWYRSDDSIPCTNVYFSVFADRPMSIHGKGIG
ncbi:unnamed protein product, partial [marine sediment metagenome]